jgi:GNAT superfamily N-acetyltransferase
VPGGVRRRPFCIDLGVQRPLHREWQEVVLMAEVVVPLTVRDLTAGDLPSCAWSGSATHLDSVARALERAARGEVDYLAVCPPSGLPVALGGVDYAKTPGAGTLWQLAVHGALHSCGIGTILIQAAEQRIRARGRTGRGGVQPALYERLGYVAYGREPASWDEEAPDGSITRYETVCTLMRKDLPYSRAGGRRPSGCKFSEPTSQDPMEHLGKSGTLGFVM